VFSRSNDSSLDRIRIVGSSVGLWLAVPVLVASLLGSSVLRAGSRSFLACWLVLIAWFLLARTKTLRWSWVVRLFVAGLAVAVATALVSDVLASAVGLHPADSGVAVGIAGTVEEAAKLAPLLVLCLAVPGRVRRFSPVDWMLAGVASGLGFQAAEDAVRRISWAAAARADVLGGQGDPWSDARSGFPHYRFSLLSGSADAHGHAVFPGHGVLTGLVALAIGVAVMTGGSTSRRLAVWCLPLLAWLVAIASHVGFAATLADQLLFEHGDSEVPRPLYLVWKATDQGRLVGPFLLVAFLAATVVEAARVRHRIAGERAAGPAWVAMTADAVSMIGADLVGIGQGVRRPVGTVPRAGRWAATVEIERRRRELAWAAPEDHPAADRTFRLAALAIGTGVGFVALVSGWRLAERIGKFLAGPGSPSLAGLLHGFDTWWSSLGIGGQLAAVLGAAALIALVAGDFGLPPRPSTSRFEELTLHRAARAAVELALLGRLPARTVPPGEVDLAGALLDDPAGFEAAFRPPPPVPPRTPAARRLDDVARLLAARGLEVREHPGTGSPMPDLLIGERRFDCVTLRTGDARQMATVLELRVVRGVATRFVLDLDDSAVDLQALRRHLDRHPVPGLEEILVVRDEHVLRFFP
jgi:hypothetical protein